jgi:hypothetical protein
VVIVVSLSKLWGRLSARTAHFDAATNRQSSRKRQNFQIVAGVTSDCRSLPAPAGQLSATGAEWAL